MNEDDLKNMAVFLNRAEITSEQLTHIIRGVQSIKNGSKRGRVILNVGASIESIQVIEDIQVVVKKFRTVENKY